MTGEISTVELERVAARGWRGTSSELLGDWLLRAGSGFTGRANSVLPLGSPGCPLDEALASVGDFYARHQLSPLFQIPVCAETADLDADLGRRGWALFNDSWVLAGDVARALAGCPPPDRRRPASFDDHLSPAWLAGYQYRGAPLPPSAVAVLVNADGVVFGSIPDSDGRAAAVVRGVLTDGWLGVTALTVDDAHRRTGLGTLLMGELLRWAAERAAERIYLQVAAENDPAQTLYGRLGLSRHHAYHYLRAPTEPKSTATKSSGAIQFRRTATE